MDFSGITLEILDAPSFGDSQDALTEAIQSAILAEREACVKIALDEEDAISER